MSKVFLTLAVHLRLGDDIVRVDPKGRVEKAERVTALDFKTCRHHVHVNGTDCYDVLAAVAVRRVSG